MAFIYRNPQTLDSLAIVTLIGAQTLMTVSPLVDFVSILGPTSSHGPLENNMLFPGPVQRQSIKVLLLSLLIYYGLECYLKNFSSHSRQHRCCIVTT